MRETYTEEKTEREVGKKEFENNGEVKNNYLWQKINSRLV